MNFSFIRHNILGRDIKVETFMLKQNFVVKVYKHEVGQKGGMAKNTKKVIIVHITLSTVVSSFCVDLKPPIFPNFRKDFHLH
jgi:hypothetical protein